MAKDKPWTPGDGAEEVDPSAAAQGSRLGSAHFTPQHRSDEPELQPGAAGHADPVKMPDDPFEPAYAAWRDTNGNRLDADYRRWRAQTGQPFSDAFLAWAQEEAAKRGG